MAGETEPQTLGSSQQDDQARPPNDVKSSNLIEDFTFFVCVSAFEVHYFLMAAPKNPKQFFVSVALFPCRKK